jgi:hypothetical protein
MALLSRSVRLCLILANLSALARTAAPPADEPLGEYEVKAAFIYNFARYVEWPQKSFRSPADPIAICVLGGDPMGHLLDEAVSGKTVEKHSLAVRRIAEIREAGTCQIVFFAASHKMPREALANLRMSGVLTVGETEGFARRGGIIGFRVEEGHHIRFDVNIEAARDANLRISSQLLSLATIVKR